MAGAMLVLVFNVVAGGEKVPEQEMARGSFVEAVKSTSKPEINYSYEMDGSIKASLHSANAKKLKEGLFSSYRENETPAPEITTHILKEEFPDLRAELKDVTDLKTTVTPRPEPGIDWFYTFLMAAPALLVAGLLYRQIKMAEGAGGGAASFGKSKAKVMNEEQPKVTFKDVAGVDEAKQELTDVVEFLSDPHKFQRLGGKMPKGVLLDGPPGCGKTLLARAVAGEAKVPFFNISGSEFVEMFVGVGAARARDLFEQAKKNTPCIIFIDEIDAIGGTRGTGPNKHEEREGTLNQLLVEMDGFDASEGVIVLAATNRPETLDSALTRSGRFDRRVTVNAPDKNGREAILRVHTKNKPLNSDVHLSTIARGTPSFSGADLENLTNEAALGAAKRGADTITMSDFEHAKEKVMMGAERKSLIMTDEERRMTAYHEAGHALISLKVPGNDPLHMVSIIPRGRALGVTVNLPIDDRFSVKKFELKARMAMAYGGRIAEEMIYGPEGISGGASNDIVQATRVARAMVTQLGMSDKVGAVNYSADQEMSFLKTFSDSTQRTIDEEVKILTKEAEDAAREVLTTHRADLDKLALALLDHEKLTGDEIRGLLDGTPIIRKETKPVTSNPPEHPTIH